MKKIAGIFSSPKTTAAGIVAFIAILASQLGYLLDTDPLTNVDWNAVLNGFLFLVLGVSARDNTKSSVDVGIQEPPKPPSNATPINGRPYGG
jgi:hypothetical protein